MSIIRSSFRITHVHMSDVTFSPISGPTYCMGLSEPLKLLEHKFRESSGLHRGVLRPILTNFNLSVKVN